MSPRYPTDGNFPDYERIVSELDLQVGDIFVHEDGDDVLIVEFEAESGDLVYRKGPHQDATDLTELYAAFADGKIERPTEAVDHVERIRPIVHANCDVEPFHGTIAVATVSHREGEVHVSAVESSNLYEAGYVIIESTSAHALVGTIESLAGRAGVEEVGQ